MRFEELSLRIPGDELRLRFHDRATIISGIGPLERQGLVDSLLGALGGDGDGATGLVYTDSQGRQVTVTREGLHVVRTFDDGTRAPDLLQLLELNAAGLRELTVVTPPDLGLMVAELDLAEPKELAETRSALAALTEQLEGALAARQAVDAMREELAGIDERLRQASEGRDKREYARLLGQLEQVRAEAAALRSGDAGNEADGRFLRSASDVLRLHSRWHETAEHKAEAEAAFGDRQPLDPKTLDQADELPDHAPSGLDTLLDDLRAAEARRDHLAARLSKLAAGHLPKPSHDAVVRLARADQDTVWGIARQAVQTGRRVQDASIALGGLPADGVQPEVVEEIENAHAAVEAAEQAVNERRRQGRIAAAGLGVLAVVILLPVPIASVLFLVLAGGAWLWGNNLPARDLAAAEEAEAEVLKKAGVPTYLSFHMRRIDATLDTDFRERLDVAILEHRAALARWHEVAGDVDPDEGLGLESEARAYAAALAKVSGVADEIDAVRAELTREAEPAVEQALDAVMRACRPFGVDNPDVARAMVDEQVRVATTARLQRQLERAGREEAELREELELQLDRLGFEDGTLDERVAAVRQARAAVRQRDMARKRARSRGEVEAELGQLEARVRREHRAEWGNTVAASDSDEPDVAELLQRRACLEQDYASSVRLVPDIEHLADRRSALERRVAVLESESGRGIVKVLETVDVEQELVARVTAARNAGARGEALPLLFEEPLARVPTERKWELLDLIHRLSERSQVVYLTNDPDVVTWARRRVGSLSLLEPVESSV